MTMKTKQRVYYQAPCGTHDAGQYRFKKRSKDIVQSWIESLPNQKSPAAMATLMAAAGATPPASEAQPQQQPQQQQEGSEGALKLKKPPIFASLSIEIPKTFTNITKNDDVIELSEEELPYFSGRTATATASLSHSATATTQLGSYHPRAEEDGHQGGQAQALVSPSWYERMRPFNARLDSLYHSIRRQIHHLLPLHAGAGVGGQEGGNGGCLYSIRTNSTDGAGPFSMSEGQRLARDGAAAVGDDEGFDAEDPSCHSRKSTKGGHTTNTNGNNKNAAGGDSGSAMADPEKKRKAEEDALRPSIARADKIMSIHKNVPSSVLTFTICAFQLTQSSGLLLSFAWFFMV